MCRAITTAAVAKCALKVRAKIEKIDAKTLNITELPIRKNRRLANRVDSQSLRTRADKNPQGGRTTPQPRRPSSCICNPGTSSDKTIDALYAFSDCEINISPNCCVIRDNKPCFLSVGDVLRHSVDTTRDIITSELQVALAELREQLLYTSLEKIFIPRNGSTRTGSTNRPPTSIPRWHTSTAGSSLQAALTRDVTRDDLLRLLEIKMKRILRFNSQAAADALVALQAKKSTTLSTAWRTSTAKP